MLRQFYARRFPRIFPLYYAVLAAGCLLDIQGFRDALGWHVAYLTNAYVILKNSWVGWASHLWTLSVEEQFYLFVALHCFVHSQKSAASSVYGHRRLRTRLPMQRRSLRMVQPTDLCGVLHLR